MRGIREILGGAILFFSALALVAWPRVSASGAAAPHLGASLAQGEEPVPAFHSEVPPGPLPQTLDPAHFADPVVKNAYHIAARVKKVLYQQPCYCHCDRSQGHGSLLDCFVSKHASMCDICIREDLYAYEQTRKGKTPAQIRAGIRQGDWQRVDIAKYETYPAKP
jgi:hypothetical protein